jgi:hypothetical protein
MKKYLVLLVVSAIASAMIVGCSAPAEGNTDAPTTTAGTTGTGADTNAPTTPSADTNVPAPAPGAGADMNKPTEGTAPVGENKPEEKK